MTLRTDLIAKIWRGTDPLAGPAGGKVDHQGWNSRHPWLSEAIFEQRPGVVVEVGVWKGESTLTMARAIRAASCDGVVIAVDTWLGSAEHWPTSGLYDTFRANVADAGIQDYVIPMRLDSGSAWMVLTQHEIQPSVVHIDAAHDYLSVVSDMTRWWRLLKPGGAMIMDDYDPSWPEVVLAVNRFCDADKSIRFDAAGRKCRLVKPDQTAT